MRCYYEQDFTLGGCKYYLYSRPVKVNRSFDGLEHSTGGEEIPKLTTLRSPMGKAMTYYSEIDGKATRHLPAW